MLMRLPELQSGFVGYPSEKLIMKPVFPQSTPVSLVINQKLTRSNQDYFFSGEIEKLVYELLNNPKSITDFEFHGRVFRACSQLFERKGLTHFLLMQEESRHMSFYHKQFFIDTLKAILFPDSYKRQFQPQVWASMISVSNDPSVQAFKIDQITEKVGSAPPKTLVELLRMWVMSLGISDLVMSLQVIFGRRTLHASAGAPNY